MTDQKIVIANSGESALLNVMRAPRPAQHFGRKGKLRPNVEFPTNFALRVSKTLKGMHEHSLRSYVTKFRLENPRLAA